MASECLRLGFDDIRGVDAELDALAGPGHPASHLRPGALSPHATAVAGHDGYLFIGDGANRWERQFRGELAVAESWLTGWSALLEQRQAEARRRGAPLWNVVIPEKQVIYPEKRWPNGEVSGDDRPLRKLLPKVGPELQLFYPEQALRAACAHGSVYFRHNSHWAPTGCCATTLALIEAVGAEVELADVRFNYRRGPVQHDLTGHFFDPAPPEEGGNLLPAGERVFDNRGLETTGRHAGSSYGLRNPEAPDRRRVIVFGDSYSYDVGFTFALSEIFLEVVFVWSKSVIWSAVERHQAQLVVWESAERFLATLPEA